jgi:hypothetical protein
MSASWALQKAVYAALIADAALTSRLGGARIHDDVPRGVERPYVTFGRWVARDLGTAAGDGEEHLFQLHVWSGDKGHRQTHEILAALRDVLHESGLTLDGHVLVNLRVEDAEARRQTDGETYQGILRLRAVTEPH